MDCERAEVIDDDAAVAVGDEGVGDVAVAAAAVLDDETMILTLC